MAYFLFTFKITWVINVPYLLKLIHVSTQGGDSFTKRAKFDQEPERRVNEEKNPVERGSTHIEQHVCVPGDSTVGTSNASMVDRTEKSGYDQLPKELNGMKIREEKGNNRNEKVFIEIQFLKILFEYIFIHHSLPYDY